MPSTLNIINMVLKVLKSTVPNTKEHWAFKIVTHQNKFIDIIKI